MHEYQTRANANYAQLGTHSANKTVLAKSNTGGVLIPDGALSAKRDGHSFTPLSLSKTPFSVGFLDRSRTGAKKVSGRITVG